MRDVDVRDRFQFRQPRAEQVRVIDADLGISAGGDAASGREGFRELVAEVALGAVGLVLGVEASRLGRDVRSMVFAPSP